MKRPIINKLASNVWNAVCAILNSTQWSLSYLLLAMSDLGDASAESDLKEEESRSLCGNDKGGACVLFASVVSLTQPALTSLWAVLAGRRRTRNQTRRLQRGSLLAANLVGRKPPAAPGENPTSANSRSASVWSLLLAA